MHALDRALLVISVDPEAGILIPGVTTGPQRPQFRPHSRKNRRDGRCGPGGGYGDGAPEGAVRAWPVPCAGSWPGAQESGDGGTGPEAGAGSV